MKVFKRVLAVLCSTTLLVSASVTALADGDTAATSATGNVIAYNFDTVVVPTTIKIAFNPQGLPVTIGEDSNGAAVTTTDKIVSLNYGIANKASTDKKVIVKFAANAVAVDGETKDLTFVDAATKTQAKSESNANGAEAGDHKIYLYVTPATAQPTINDGTEAGTAFAVTDTEGVLSENATAANLADVIMTAAADGKGVAFATGTNNDAFANIGFALDKATYALKSGESIDFDTTQSEVADKLNLTAFGTKSITGFTFKGAMNDNTVWTEANVVSISITPTYEFVEKGEEEAVEGTHGMITLEEEEDVAEPAAPVAPVTTYTVTYNANYDDADPATKTETVDIGEGPTGEGMTFTREGYTQDGWLDAANGEAVDLDDITGATTVYANWVQDVVTATGSYDSTNLQYRISLASAVTGVSDITNFKVDGNAVEINSLNGNKDIIKVDRSAVKAAVGAAWDSATEFTFTFTVDGVNYTCTISKNG